MLLKDEPQHGLIIVDTSFIDPYALPIPRHYLTVEAQKRAEKTRKEPTILSATLPLLAHSGFHVVIPEMVVYEAANMLQDGSSPSDRFHTNNEAKKEFLKKARHWSKLFLQEVIHSNNPHIAIAPPSHDPTSPVFTFLHRLKNGIKINSRSEIITLTHENTSDYGDIAAAAIVANLPKNWKTPIFYLTGDSGATDRLRKTRPDLRITMVNPKGFLAALHYNQLDSCFGVIFKNKEIIDKFAMEQLCASRKKWESAIPTDRAFIDTSQPYGTPPDQLFQATIAQAKDQILAAAQAQLEAEKPKMPGILSEAQEARLAREAEAARAARLAKFSRHPLSRSANGNGPAV